MEYCSKCDKPMNGFNYGYGVNPICGNCNDLESKERKVLRIMELEIEKVKAELMVINMEVKKRLENSKFDK